MLRERIQDHNHLERRSPFRLLEVNNKMETDSEQDAPLKVQSAMISSKEYND